MITTVERICQQCGEHFLATPNHIRQRAAKFCSRSCYKKSLQAYKVECTCEQCGKQFSRKPSQVGVHVFCSMNCFREYSKGKSTQVLKARQGIMKKQWQDPEWVAKEIAALNRKPTVPEKQVQGILDKYFPQFKYNGDFSLGITLAGHIPDFVNVNGKKEVIEVFGDYWHSPEIDSNNWRRSELGKIMLYNSVGYRCLVIWEHDLKIKSEDEIITMVKSFTKRR